MLLVIEFEDGLNNGYFRRYYRGIRALYGNNLSYFDNYYRFCNI
jgi:hypothetical protein